MLTIYINFKTNKKNKYATNSNIYFQFCLINYDQVLNQLSINLLKNSLITLNIKLFILYFSS